MNQVPYLSHAMDLRPSFLRYSSVMLWVTRTLPIKLERRRAQRLRNSNKGSSSHLIPIGRVLVTHNMALEYLRKDGLRSITWLRYGT